MRASSEAPTHGVAPSKPKRSRMKMFAVSGLAGVAFLGGLSIVGVDDVIDLPAWAQIPGVDVPLIGDTDQLGCELHQVEGTTDVRITLSDGDESTYDEYIYVFNNGEFRQPEEITRLSPDTLISPSREYFGDQWFSIATEPLRESRVYCSNINVVDPDA